MRFILLAIIGATLLMAGKATAQFGELIGMTNTIWRYWIGDDTPGPGWNSPTFNDSTWPSGRGLFGDDSGYPYPMATPVLGPSKGGPMTVYYRTRFAWQGSTSSIILTGTNHVDDGCVIYLNGVEITRFNMPAGIPEFLTAAPAANPGGFPNLNAFEPVTVVLQIPLDTLTNGNANPLVAGENVLAVEVHQNAFSSSDHVFGMSLRGSIVEVCAPRLDWTERTVTTCQSVVFRVLLPFCAGVLQWYFMPPGGSPTPILGATGQTLTLNDVKFADAGKYFCRAQNSVGTADSDYATLQVVPDNTPPAIQYAYAPVTPADELRVIFDEPIQLPADWLEAVAMWRVSGSSFDVVREFDVAAAFVDNENEVVLLMVEEIRSDWIYTFSTLQPIADRCGGNLLAAGASGVFRARRALVDFDSRHVWRYHDTGFDPGPGWNQPGYDDSLWKSGAALFDRNANELGRAVVAGQFVRTSLALDAIGVTPPVRIPSYLFRIPIVVPTNATDFIATVIPDDGFVLYVNGREVFRLGVPVAADLFASFGGVHVSPETAVQQVFAIPATNFIAGTNVLAVLLKQVDSSSPDVTFGLRLTAVVDPRFVAVDPRPARQPQSTMAVEGHRWSMDVFYPSDFWLVYQWFHDGIEVAGAHTETITGVAKASDSGAYWVVIGSVAGPITSAPATLQVVPVILPYTFAWRYQTNQQDATLATTPWYSSGFDDATWPTGSGPFGLETTSATLAGLPSPIATPLPVPDQTVRTVYFRGRVTIPPTPAGETLVLCHTIDDGAVIYVDGQPIHRYNLTNDLPILSAAPAAGPVPGNGDAQIICVPVVISAGEHLIAVEVHEPAQISSDRVFGLELRFTKVPEALAISAPAIGNWHTVTWRRDPFWELVQGGDVAGSFTPVTVPGVSLQATFTSISSTNRFYRLRFHGR